MNPQCIEYSLRIINSIDLSVLCTEVEAIISILMIWSNRFDSKYMQGKIRAINEELRHHSGKNARLRTFQKDPLLSPLN